MSAMSTLSPLRRILVIGAVLSLGACSTWSHSEVKPNTGGAGNTPQSASTSVETPKVAATNPASIIVTKEDITDRKYTVLGDIKVTVNKTTLFHDDPTPALVDEELKSKAAELGADAVILIRYGTPGVSLFSWGSLDGQGRAVKFVK
jgi:hypothetical protein